MTAANRWSVSQGSVTNWLQQLKSGEDGAFQQQLWNRYFHQLVQIAQSRLSRTVRSLEDEEDVALSALNSFFRRAKLGQFSELADRTNLWPLLVHMTICKTRNVHRRQHALKRDARRNVSESGSDIDDFWLDTLSNSEPTPELAIQAAEEAERLITSLDKESLQVVARMKLEGYTNAEIAEHVGVMERSVERRLALIRQLWAEHFDTQFGQPS